MGYLENARLPHGVPFYYLILISIERAATTCSQTSSHVSHCRHVKFLTQRIGTIAVGGWSKKTPRAISNTLLGTAGYTDISLHTLDFNDTDPGDEWKICVPLTEQERALREAHDEPTAGHLGIAKTLVRLSHKYYWPEILRTATKYVRSCLSCQKYKAQQQATAGKMRTAHVERTWDMVSTDLIGPLFCIK